MIDGYSVLHELYPVYQLEWATGGQYSSQVEATLKYYRQLVKAGVEPLVVLDGGGTESNVMDTFHRRNRDINSLSGEVRKQHESAGNKEYSSHHLPILSRMAYLSSLKQAEGVSIVIADGKALNMAVQLANSHGCPILTNNSNYCVSGVDGGVVFTRDLKVEDECCAAPIFHQRNLVALLNFPSPDLLLALVAIMGDGSSTTIPTLYHGGIKADIEKTCVSQGIEIKDRLWFFNIADYFRVHQCQSFKSFKDKIEQRNFGYKQRRCLAENCRATEEIYTIPRTDLRGELLKEFMTLRCSGDNKVLERVIPQYRRGCFPPQVMNAVCVGKCTLDSNVGDPDQPPIPHIGRYIRRVAYGLASPLMSRSYRNSIEEYYRSEEKSCSDDSKPWEYFAYKLEPHCWRYRKLSVDVIYDLEEKERKQAATDAMLEVLSSPEGVLEKFCQEKDGGYLLGVLTTQCWARNVRKYTQLEDFFLLVRALILSFLLHPEEQEEASGLEQGYCYAHPMWVKVYHAFLEWQSLYLDVCGLNQMLLSPLQELHPSRLPNGSFVMGVALSGPEGLAPVERRLGGEERERYNRIMGLLEKEE